LRLPNLTLSRREIDVIVAYLESMAEKVSASGGCQLSPSASALTRINAPMAVGTEYRLERFSGGGPINGE